MGFDVGKLVETVAKLAIFLPVMGLVIWWLVNAWWVERALHLEEFAVGVILWSIAFSFGVRTIIEGGWGSLTIIGLVYLALLSLAVWEYLFWRHAELKHLESEVTRYQRAIDKDPTAVAAYSMLGETFLKLRQYKEAEEALEQAIKMDPESKKERRLLERAQRQDGGPSKWWRVD